MQLPHLHAQSVASGLPSPFFCQEPCWHPWEKLETWYHRYVCARWWAALPVFWPQLEQDVEADFRRELMKSQGKHVLQALEPTQEDKAFEFYLVPFLD